jgi:SlyX protein
MANPASDDRLIQLEMAVAHLQHDLEQMHQSLVSMHDELRVYREQVSRFERRLTLLAEPPEVRSPLDERPPHY